MEKEKVYLNSELPVEERVEDLLRRMTLEEKIGQLKVRAYPFRLMFFKLLEGLPEDQRKRHEGFMKKVFKERGFWDSLLANCWRKHWKEVVIEEGKYGIGAVGWVLLSFSPREGAEFSNEIQKFALEKTHLGIPVMIQMKVCMDVGLKVVRFFLNQ